MFRISRNKQYDFARQRFTYLGFVSYYNQNIKSYCLCRRHNSVLVDVKISSLYPKNICIIIDAIVAVILILTPDDTHPVMTLYPVAFAMSIQWCTFRGVEKIECHNFFDR